MKKVTLFFAFLAGIAVMTGCKKEQTVVTFKAVVDQDTKAYFGTQTQPYWNTDDQVCIMGTDYSEKQTCVLKAETVSESYAEIKEVPILSNAATSYYCAIYPATAAEKIGIPASDGTTQAVIYFPPHQEYILENGHQRVNMPMGAVTNNTDKTFHFKNLCSILRLHVTNNLLNRKDMQVSRVTIYGYGAYLAGSAAVNLTPSGVTSIDMDGPYSSVDIENVLSLYSFNDDYMQTIEYGHEAYFDVVVPPFINASKLNIELEMYDGDEVFLGNSDATINGPLNLDYNNIVTIDLNVQGYEKPDYAYLARGEVFNQIIRGLIGGQNVINITFNPSWNNVPVPPEPWDQATIDNSYGTAEDWSAWKIVSAEDSPYSND